MTNRLLFAVLNLVFVICVGATASAEVLRIGGAGGALEMMKQMVAPFAAATGIKAEIIPNLGSNGALQAVNDGAIDAAVSSRSLTAEESGSGLEATLFARTPLVFVTSKSKPNGWFGPDLARIFEFEIKVWEDGTPINVILRPKGDTDTKLISVIFPGMAAAIEQARRRRDVPVAFTDQDSAELAEHLDGSFVQLGLNQVIAEKRKLNPVPIDGSEPSLSNFENGTYLFEKPYFLVFKFGNRRAEQLLEFLQSPDGQKILRKNGNLPVVD